MCEWKQIMGVSSNLKLDYLLQNITDIFQRLEMFLRIANI